jgi:hypothetical protein
LLHHWRLTLDPPAAPGEVAARWNGRPLALESPGAFRSSSPDCVVAPQGWTALCRLGRGRVRLVADADLMRDALWAPDGPGAAPPTILPSSASGSTSWPERRGRARVWRRAEGFGRWIALALLAAAAAGIGLLLRRRRTR